MEHFRINGDGQAVQELLDWLAENGGPYMLSRHPMEPIVGPGYNLQRTSNESWDRQQFTYNLVIDDDQLLTAYKLRWL